MNARFLGLAALCLFMGPGCLSLGGTTYAGESPETSGRLSSLETRVSALEHSVMGPSSQAAPAYAAPSYSASDSP